MLACLLGSCACRGGKNIIGVENNGAAGLRQHSWLWSNMRSIDVLLEAHLAFLWLEERLGSNNSHQWRHTST
jgi:hypothetical protein